MDPASVLLNLGTVGSVYFLTTMLLAVVHGEAGARARAVGLVLCLLLMLAATLFRPLPDYGPASPPPRRYPPRVPNLRVEETLASFPGRGGISFRGG